MNPRNCPLLGPSRSLAGLLFASLTRISLEAAGTVQRTRRIRDRDRVVLLPIEAARGYRGGGAEEDGAGVPSTVFGSISSMRVPSGSYRFSCRLRLMPVLISRAWG